jgi:hypothetical protein
MKTSDAAAIIAVANQPMSLNLLEMMNLPMIFVFDAMRISNAMTGTATIAFKTADHTNAFTGLTDMMFAAAPTTVAAAMAA